MDLPDSDWFVAQGPLGVLCLCLIAALIVVWTRHNTAYKELLALKDKRTEDHRKFTEVLTKQNEISSNLALEVSESVLQSRFTIESAMLSQKGTLESLDRAVEKNTDAVRDLCTAVKIGLSGGGKS